MMATGIGVSACNLAFAQPGLGSPVALPEAIPGDTRPVMVIGGIESAAQDPEAISPDPTNIVNENAQQSAPPGPSGDRQKPGKALGGGGRAELQPDFEHLLSSPAIKKFLELMRENMELKAQIKILGIQSESKMRMHDMELKVEQLRRELNESNAALKDATLSKERLEKRISELEHRSRLLEERAKAIGSQKNRHKDASRDKKEPQ